MARTFGRWQRKTVEGWQKGMHTYEVGRKVTNPSLPQQSLTGLLNQKCNPVDGTAGAAQNITKTLTTADRIQLVTKQTIDIQTETSSCNGMIEP